MLAPLMKTLLLSPLLAAGLMAAPPAANGLKSKTTHAEAYGPTRNAVTVDPAKDLPRYPAVEAAEAVATWQVKKGFKLELAAHEPLVRDPIAVCFDERGRMFVCEMIDYSEMRDVTPHLGRISVLEDKDGDGVFETGRVFADNLPWPTGLIWANGGLYVGATPDIWRFEDRDGDGRAEVREKIYTGFGTGLKILNVQGLMNSFQWGPDNRVHVLAGGGNRGLVTCLKRPELAGQELGGRDFWFDPLTHEFGLEGGGAQYGMSFDNYGRKFGCSNSDHLQFWVYDDRLAARDGGLGLPAARKSIAVDGGAAEVFRISPDEPWRIIRTRWRIAGVVKGAVEGGGRVSGYFTGATGTTIYRGDAYGAEFVNNSFSGDAGGQLVHRKILRPADNGIDLIGERPADERGFEFAASKDTWVRVVNFANAPDGCLYVCDMYREVIEHPWSVPDEIKKHLDLNSGNDRGRIYRIVPEGWTGRKERRTRPGLEAAGTAALVQTLGHANGWHRDTAQRLLYERQDPQAATRLKQQLGETPLARLHGLSVLDGLKAVDAAVLVKALADADPQVRERAVLASVKLAQGRLPSPPLWQALQTLTDDPAPRVRFAKALLLGSLRPAEADGRAALVREKLRLAERDAGNAWITAAVLNGSTADALALLEAAAGAKSPLLEADFGAQLLGLIGQRQEPAGRAYVLQLLTEPGRPEAFRRQGLKAFAQGLRSVGSSMAAVDSDGRLNGLFTQAAATAADAQAAVPARLQALDLLSLAPGAQALPVLQACLQAGLAEPVQNAAVQALNTLAGKQAPGLLLAAWGGLKPQARAAVLSATLARDDGALAVLAAMQAGKGGPLPQDLPASQVQELIKHKNTRVAAEARQVLKAVIPPSREEVAAKYAAAVTLAGKAMDGQNHYISRCMGCHRANGMGLEVGPDLTTVKTKGRDALLTAILEPHKEVASQYIAYTVNTKDGQTLSGIITKDDASSLSVKMMGGVEIHVQRANVKGSSSSGQSLMPEGLESGLSVQDMADLLSFIESL